MKMFFVTLLLSATALAQPSDLIVPINIQGDLYGHSITKTGITLMVGSGGCLDKSYFSVQQTRSIPPQISITQLKPDTCEGVFSPAPIEFTFDELGLKQYHTIKISTQATIRIL